MAACPEGMGLPSRVPQRHGGGATPLSLQEQPGECEVGVEIGAFKSLQNPLFLSP